MEENSIRKSIKNNPLLQINIYGEDFVDTYTISNKQSSYWLFRSVQHIKEPFIEIYRKKGNWYLRDNETYSALTKEDHLLVSGKVSFVKGNSLLLVYMEEVENTCFQAYQIPAKESFLLGRDEKCDICIKHPYLSKEHICFVYENRELYLYDKESKNGVYVNSLRVYEKKLQDGDCIH